MLSDDKVLIRALVATTFQSVKLDHFGLRSVYSIDVYKGPVKGHRPPKAMLVRRIKCRRNPAIFNCYQSFTQSETGDAGEEQVLDGRGNAFKSMRTKVALLSFLLVPFVVWASVRVVTGFRDRVAGGKPARSAEHSEALPLASPGAVAAVVVKLPAPQISKAWRYAGVVVVSGRTFYVLDGGDIGARRVEERMCSRDTLGQMFCRLDGELITAWSGPSPPLLNQLLSASTAVASGR